MKNNHIYELTDMGDILHVFCNIQPVVNVKWTPHKYPLYID